MNQAALPDGFGLRWNDATAQHYHDGDALQIFSFNSVRTFTAADESNANSAAENTEITSQKNNRPEIFFTITAKQEMPTHSTARAIRPYGRRGRATHILHKRGMTFATITSYPGQLTQRQNPMSEWKVIIFIITAFTIMLLLMAAGVHWAIQLAAGMAAVCALCHLWTSLNRPPQQ